MKKMTLFSLVGLLVLCWSTGAFAQTALTTTTLTTAMTASQSTMVVAAASGFTARTTVAFVDRELVTVTSVSGTTITIGRPGQANPHLAGSVVHVGPRAAFLNNDPNGSCSAAATGYTPLVNIGTGRLWKCNARGSWVGSSLEPVFPGVMPIKEVADANYTATAGDVVIMVTSISASATTRTITLPSATNYVGKIYIIKDATNAFAAGANTIWISGTINQVAGTTNGAIVTAYGLRRLIAACPNYNGAVVSLSCTWLEW